MGSGSAWAALDFVPEGEQLGCYPSDARVTAMTGGLEYDSNITVTGDVAQEQDDGRGVIRLQGMVRPI